MRALAEFEHSLIRERQRLGIALAKPRHLQRTEEDLDAVLVRDLRISRETAYQYLLHA